MMNDIRWKQRFNNYKKALALLEEVMIQTTHTAIEKEGAIQRFEYTYELAWLTLKDYLFFEGFTNIGGSRDTFKQAFNQQLITNPDMWTDMIISRQMTSHTYNQETANAVFNDVKNKYLNLFLDLKKTLNNKN